MLIEITIGNTKVPIRLCKDMLTMRRGDLMRPAERVTEAMVERIVDELVREFDQKIDQYPYAYRAKFAANLQAALIAKLTPSIRAGVEKTQTRDRPETKATT